ncbi:type II-A CRISPR-associated protein Csn2 [Enterococcus rivorum]|uniref:type II-A CRISPR-associated protein Csn2 n=1 Tax=Enterococcus rivorum TaxID=762845 RepID=UPI000A043E28
MKLPTRFFQSVFGLTFGSHYIPIFNPLSFDFDERSIKTLLYNRLITQIGYEIDKKHEIEHDYRNMIYKLIQVIDENNDLDLMYKDELNYKELFKMIGLSIDQKMQTSIFEKIQLLINTLNDLAGEKLLIFTHLNILLTNQEYKYIMEQIDLNNQTVLIIESSQYILENIPHYYLDSDFFLSHIML